MTQVGIQDETSEAYKLATWAALGGSCTFHTVSHATSCRRRAEVTWSRSAMSAGLDALPSECGQTAFSSRGKIGRIQRVQWLACLIVPFTHFKCSRFSVKTTASNSEARSRRTFSGRDASSDAFGRQANV